MANPRLSVEIGANIDQLRNGLRDATLSLNNFTVDANGNINGLRKPISALQEQMRRFGEQLRNSTNPRDIQRLNSAIEETQRRINATNQILNRGSGGLGNIATGANQASFALTNLGRVAQDAPFGFIGISNNLNPLLESFQRLRQETGSSSAALKALGSSLLGAGGIGLALSIVTSALTFYTMWQQKANKATKEGADATKSYLDTLDQVTAAQIRGSQNAQKDLTDVRLLYKAYQDANLPLKDRKLAYEALQKQYPAYFGNLSFEKTAGESTTKAYNELTTSILAAARARAASDQLTKNASREFENENRRIDARVKLEDALAKRRKAQAFLDNTGTTSEFSGVRAKYEKEIAGYSDIISENSKIIREANIDTGKLNEYNIRLEQLATGEKIKQLSNTKEVNKELDKQADKIAAIYKTLANELKSNPLNFGASEFQIVEDNIKSYQKAIDNLIANGYNPASEAVQKLTDKQLKLAHAFIKSQPVLGKTVSSTQLAPQAQERLDNRANPEQDIIDRTSQITVKASEALQALRSEYGYTNEEVANFIDRYDVSIEEFLKINQNWANGLNEIIKSAPLDLLSNLGSSIGEAFASGASIIDAAAGSILGSIGSILTKFGQLTLAAGIASTALGKALSNPFNPASGAAAIAAGVALIAIGSAVRAFSSNIGKGSTGNSGEDVKPVRAFASGGYNLPGGMALVGERGPELVDLPTGSDVIPNNRSMNMLNNNRSDTIVLGGKLAISMGQLVVEIDRERERMRR